MNESQGTQAFPDNWPSRNNAKSSKFQIIVARQNQEL